MQSLVLGRSQGKRHRLPTVLVIAAAATLCGMQGYRAMADWAGSLSQKARERFGCRVEDIPALFLDVSIDIEAESRGRARRIFIRRGGELRQIVAIEELPETVALANTIRIFGETLQ
ncbi:transposase family protein [Syntrophorhabdus aromaticivorans]|uniref:transposase family protein n=1 Tax=Syntrophorhabdus aromaticivorans TaxID=328301 RepID=UPI0009FC0966